MSSYASLQEKSRFDDTFGTISALGDKVTIACEGTASATVSIKGTFSGRIEVYGSAADGVTTRGGRLAFLSSTGSVGSNILVNNGTTWDKEFRFVTGGNKLTLEAIEWDSGSVEVQVSVSQASSLVFVNGPVHNAEEEAVRSGRAFLAGLSGTALTSGQEVHFILRNPATSTRSLYLTERLFASVASSNIEYKAYANPTNILTGTGVAVARKVGSQQSLAEFTFQVATADTIVLNGAGGSSEPIPITGEVRERKLLVIVPPDNSLGFTIRGAGNNLGQAARIWSTLQWYEEDAVI